MLLRLPRQFVQHCLRSSGEAGPCEGLIVVAKNYMEVTHPIREYGDTGAISNGGTTEENH